MDEITARVVSATDAADLDACGSMLHAFNVEFDDPAPAPDFLSRRLQKLIDDTDTAVLIAGIPACAVAVLRFRESIWEDAMESYLAELYVVPDQRGNGIGGAIMELAIAEARRRGTTSMEINVDEPDTGARHFYERLGFTNRSGGPDGPFMFFYERSI